VTRRDAIPLEAVRDLLGIARAMYAAAKRQGASADVEELAEIGKKLKLALDLAKKAGPDSIGHRAAWDHAEVACSRLIRLISATTPAAPIVEAATVRIRRFGSYVSEGELKRVAARKRS
jgi:hypothetical protein